MRLPLAHLHPANLAPALLLARATARPHHTYFHHRNAFVQAEAESLLYARFLALVSAEFLIIPPRMGEDDNVDGGLSGDEHSDAGQPKLARANCD